MKNYEDTVNYEWFQKWSSGVIVVLSQFNEFIQKNSLVLQEVNWKGVLFQGRSNEYTIRFIFDTFHNNYGWTLIDVELILDEGVYKLNTLIQQTYPNHFLSSMTLEAIRMGRSSNSEIERLMYELFFPILKKNSK